VDEDIARAGRGPFAVEVDLMQPVDPERKPKVNDPALNHVGLWVDDLRAAVAWLESRGMRFTPGGIRKGAAGHDVCFIHPKGSAESPASGEGVLIELVRAPPDVIAAFARGTRSVSPRRSPGGLRSRRAPARRADRCAARCRSERVISYSRSTSSRAMPPPFWENRGSSSTRAWS
jgi:catechol 2,3-dioxygenase-like lactoylglutathione lyase family enzyme